MVLILISYAINIENPKTRNRKEILTMNNMQSQKELLIETNAELLKVIANPSRIQIILALLPDKKLSVREIVDIVQMPQSTVSQHLAKLRGRVVQGKRNGLEVHYHICNPKIVQINEILFSQDH